MSIEIGKIVKIRLNGHHEGSVHEARVTEWSEVFGSGLVEVIDGPAKGMRLDIAQWMHGYMAIDAKGRAYRVSF